MTPQLQEAEMLPELAEEFVNVPCDWVLFVRKQLKMSVSADVRGGQNRHI